MSGVQSGTRLERLYQLRDRIAQEIAVEERHQLDVVRATMPLPRPDQIRPTVVPKVAPRTGPAPSAAAVREWARGRGMPVPSRGRVPWTLVDEYLQAGGQ